MAGKRFIYADNAATTRMSGKALDAMMRYLTMDYGNASQPYAFARGPKKALSEAREIIASCIGAASDEIYFTSGGTESDNWALINAWRQGKRIITSQIEHHAVLNTCAYIERCEGTVEYLPVSSGGIVNLSAISERVNDDTLVSVMTVNNEIGTIEPLHDIAAIVRERGAILHTDAVQAVGHIPIDVRSLGVDMLSASAHKFNGPKGIGFLYVRKGISLYPLIQGGSQERGMRAGTENVASIMGMAVALKENVDEMEQNRKHLQNLENLLISRLEDGHVSFVRNGFSQSPGLISLSFEGMDGEAILHRLDLKGICISTGSACDSKNTKVSHVLSAIGLPEAYSKGTIRISLGKNNTEKDVAAIAENLAKIVMEH